MKRTIFLLMAMFFMFLLMMMGCGDKSSPTDAPDDQFNADIMSPEEMSGDRDGCFELVYPITFIMPDRSTITVNSEAEMETELRSWFEANPREDRRPFLQYPVDIILEDGTTVTINNEREMRGAYEDCGDRPGDGGNREDCFEYALPVTFIMADGSTITVNTEEDWVTLRGWYADHPDVRERPAVQYPVDVTLVEDGTTVTVNNDEEMRAIYADCYDRPGGDDDGEYDCPELRANIGDDCRTEDGVVGVINDNCECE